MDALIYRRIRELQLYYAVNAKHLWQLPDGIHLISTATQSKRAIRGVQIKLVLAKENSLISSQVEATQFSLVTDGRQAVELYIAKCVQLLRVSS